MGMIADPESGKRVVHALILIAVYSRHCFVWLTFRQTNEAVLAGLEAAWAFFQGVFAVIYIMFRGTHLGRIRPIPDPAGGTVTFPSHIDNTGGATLEG